MAKKGYEIRKYLIYMLLLVFISALQTSSVFSSKLNFFHVDLLPFFIAAVALLETPLCAEIFAVFVGIFADLASLSPDGLLMAYYLIIALCMSFISRKYFRKYLPVCLILGSGSLFIQRTISYIFYFRLAYSIPLTSAAKSIFAQIALSAAFSVILFLAMRKTHAAFTVETQE